MLPTVKSCVLRVRAPDKPTDRFISIPLFSVSSIIRVRTRLRNVRGIQKESRLLRLSCQSYGLHLPQAS